MIELNLRVINGNDKGAPIGLKSAKVIKNLAMNKRSYWLLNLYLMLGLSS